MDARLKQMRRKLTQGSLDALILSSPYNISYLSGYRSRDSCLIITKGKSIYFTDSRYIEEAKRRLHGFVIKKISDNLPKTIRETSVNLNLKRIGFEAGQITFAQHQRIKELNKKAEFVPTFGLVESLRQVKEAGELTKIRKAVDIAIKAFGFAKKNIRAGRREIEVAAELERFIRYNGAYASSFDIIVASGPNSSFPHHTTGKRRIKNNEPVLIDLGVDYLGYKSDLTRVFFLGKITPIIRKAYEIVLRAQDEAIGLIRPGECVSNVDAAARQYIAQKGYGGFFGHSLGHGVGLEVHEAPRVAQKENSKLAAGMVFTVEPGIYLAGKFGIRIEDMVLVTKKGCDIISGPLNK